MLCAFTKYFNSVKLIALKSELATCNMQHFAKLTNKMKKEAMHCALFDLSKLFTSAIEIYLFVIILIVI